MTVGRYFLFCLKLHFRQRREVALPLFFFLIVASLFPLTLPAKFLPLLAPAVLWITALLAILLSLNNLFREDVEDGFITQIFLSPTSPSLLVVVKLLAHWLAYIVPLFVALPLLGLWYNLPTEALSVLALSLLLGTPTLLALGALAAALSAGLKQGGTLLMLITQPLTTRPVPQPLRRPHRLARRRRRHPTPGGGGGVGAGGPAAPGRHPAPHHTGSAVRPEHDGHGRKRAFLCGGGGLSVCDGSCFRYYRPRRHRRLTTHKHGLV